MEFESSELFDGVRKFGTVYNEVREFGTVL